MSGLIILGLISILISTGVSAALKCQAQRWVEYGTKCACALSCHGPVLSSYVLGHGNTLPATYWSASMPPKTELANCKHYMAKKSVDQMLSIYRLQPDQVNRDESTSSTFSGWPRRAARSKPPQKCSPSPVSTDTCRGVGKPPKNAKLAAGPSVVTDSSTTRALYSTLLCSLKHQTHLLITTALLHVLSPRSNAVQSS